MRPFYADESVTLYQADALALLRSLPDASANLEAAALLPPHSTVDDPTRPA